VPIGVTLSFLITVPLVNEAAIALLLGMFGPGIAGLLGDEPKTATPSTLRPEEVRPGPTATPATGTRFARLHAAGRQAPCGLARHFKAPAVRHRSRTHRKGRP
jgi:hypothetical protein